MTDPKPKPLTDNAFLGALKGGAVEPTFGGALSFMRSGDPSLGSFADATILKRFGDVPTNLDEL